MKLKDLFEGNKITEGWTNHKDGKGTFTADMSEIEHLSRAPKCPGCSKPLSIKEFKVHRDRENDITEWTLNHDCGAKLKIFNEELMTEGKNHLGDAEYNTWSGWRAAAKKKDPAVWFEGDKDIAQAMVGPKPYKDGKTIAIGEWDGEKGSIFSDANIKNAKEKNAFNAAEAGFGQSARDFAHVTEGLEDGALEKAVLAALENIFNSKVDSDGKRGWNEMDLGTQLDYMMSYAEKSEIEKSVKYAGESQEVRDALPAFLKLSAHEQFKRLKKYFKGMYF